MRIEEIEALPFTQDDFTTRLMNDIDPVLLTFIKQTVNSFIKWDLVKFFQQNPHTTDNADNIAKYIGRHGEDVQPELDNLTMNGIIIKTALKDGGEAIYTLTNDDVLRGLMAQFIKACENRHFRVKAVYHIIQKEQV